MADDVVPAGYEDLLEQVKAEVRTSRVRAARAANTELVSLYWRLGHLILDRQRAQGWGSKVVERLATDLRREFPGMRGWSRSNLFYMRSFAEAWCSDQIVQQAVGQLPWGHVTVLLDKLDDTRDRDWYAAAAVQHGWSRDVLAHQITSRLHQRVGAAPSNFGDRLPAADTDLAQQMLRDPYVFDFLDLADRAGERELETALTDRLQAFLLELGHGFAFVGRNDRVVRYSLAGSTAPMAVASYEALPQPVRDIVPSTTELSAALLREV